jgi:DNA-binding transcriptional ArsR family regulator
VNAPVASVIELPARPSQFDSPLRGTGGGTNPDSPSEPFRFAKQLPFAPIAEKLADVPIDPPWAWEGMLLPGGLTLLAGRPKVGKSTKTFGLMGALSRGERFAGRETRRTGILLLSEERQQTLAEKMDRFGLDGSVDLLMRHEAAGVSWPEIIEQAVARCQERGLGALFIDGFDKWAGLRGDSENSSGPVLEAVEPLTLAAASGLAVLIVAHQRKSGGEFGEAVRGSNALAGAVDVILELERPPATLEAVEGTRILRAVSRFASTPDELTLRLVDDTYEVDEAPLTKTRVKRARLLEALEKLEQASVDELADETSIAKSTVGRYLKALQAEGVVVSDEARGVRGEAVRWRARPETSSTTDFPRG